jgi:hypothetical protein
MFRKLFNILLLFIFSFRVIGASVGDIKEVSKNTQPPSFQKAPIEKTNPNLLAFLLESEEVEDDSDDIDKDFDDFNAVFFFKTVAFFYKTTQHSPKNTSFTQKLSFQILFCNFRL